MPKCPNCGMLHPGNFCASCGQNQKDLHISFWLLFKDFANTLFSLESKLFKSIVPLFFNPGMLTLAFIRGQRSRFVSPVRIYLFWSLVFFITIAAVNRSDDKNLKPKLKQTLEELLAFPELDPDLRRQLANQLRQQRVDSLMENYRKRVENELRPMNLQTSIDEVMAWVVKPPQENEEAEQDWQNDKDLQKQRNKYHDALGRIQNSYERKLKAIDEGKEIKASHRNFAVMDDKLDESTAIGRWLNRKLEERTEYLNNLDPNIRNQLFLNTYLSSMSKVLFLLMPLFALFLKIVYIRRNAYYIDHFIFALHYHALLFGIYSVLVWILQLFSPTWLIVLTVLIIMFGSPIILWFSMKRVYRQNWFKTTVKFFILSAIYVPSLIGCLFVALILALFSV